MRATRSPTSAERAPPEKSAENTEPSPEAAAPFETGIELGSGGDGVSLPPLSGAGTPAKTPPPALPPATRREIVAKPKALADCAEAPSKPTVLDRPIAIEYSAEARSTGIEGRLVLKVTIGADGSVAKVEVVEGVDPGLDASAIAAVQTWRFQPASRCGKPFDGGVYTLARRFELGD